MLVGSLTPGCGRPWERFDYPNCGFSVELPEKPKEAIEALETPAGALKMHVYYAGDKSSMGDALMGGDFFLVYCTEGGRAGGADPLPHLERKVTGTLRGSIAERSTIAVGEYNGVDLAVEGRNANYRVRILEGRGHSYALVADDSLLGRRAAKAFLASFRPI